MINNYLHNNHMTKYQFAKECGLPYGTFNDICTGKTDVLKCTGETLLKIAKTIGCTVDDLLNNRLTSSSYNLNNIKKAVSPIAKRHHLHEVYVFGSWARNEATEDSDIDILIDREGSDIRGMFGLNALYNELKDALGKEIDLITVQALQQESTMSNCADFVENVMTERVKIYG